MTQIPFQGRVALVTGAGRGFGRSIAHQLAREGAHVAITSRTRRELDQTAAEIEASGGTVIAVEGDSRSLSDVRRIVAETESRLGTIDILINNAGVAGPFGPFSETDPDAWWSAQEVHIRGPFNFIHAVLPGMTRQQHGHIVNVSARASHLIAPYLSAYCVGKNAQVKMAALLAAEVRTDHIYAFSIDPGFVVTQLARDTMSAADARRWVPGMVQRLGEREAADTEKADLARCAQRCVDLASGRYDALSGNYYELTDDLDEALSRLRGSPGP